MDGEMPAFPVDNSYVDEDTDPDYIGMTFRDYIAVRAMQSVLITNSALPAEIVAERAYEIAEKMVDESKKY